MPEDQNTTETSPKGGNYKALILLLILIIAGGLIYFATKSMPENNINNNNNGNATPIVTFQGCVEAGNPVMESFPEQCRTADGVLFVNWGATGQMCAQVITPATNPATGETRSFPTPCDVPQGWEPETNSL